MNLRAAYVVYIIRKARTLERGWWVDTAGRFESVGEKASVHEIGTCNVFVSLPSKTNEIVVLSNNLSSWTRKVKSISFLRPYIASAARVSQKRALCTSEILKLEFQVFRQRRFITENNPS